MAPTGATKERQALDPAAVECGNLLAAFRKAKGLRQEDLATKLGVEQGTISKWERGRRIPRDYHRSRLSGELGDTNGVIFRRLGVAS